MQFLRQRICVLAGLMLTASLTAAPPGAPTTDSFHRLMREAVVALLREGNARFVAAQPQHPNLDAERRRHTVAEGQEPFATILACADSRVPVELVFDRGIGDLFVVRVAGHVAGPSEVATAEYGVSHLRTPLLVVLGHTRCGAVTAVAEGAPLHGHLTQLAEKIQPAVNRAKAEARTPDEWVPRAIEQNVWQTIADLIAQSAELRQRLAARQLILLGAIYNLETGEVAWLGPHPAEAVLVQAPKPTSSPPGNPETHASSPGSSEHPLPLAVPASTNAAAVAGALASSPPEPDLLADPQESLRREPIRRPVTHPAKSF